MLALTDSDVSLHLEYLPILQHCLTFDEIRVEWRGLWKNLTHKDFRVLLYCMWYFTFYKILVLVALTFSLRWSHSFCFDFIWASITSSSSDSTSLFESEPKLLTSVSSSGLFATTTCQSPLGSSPVFINGYIVKDSWWLVIEITYTIISWKNSYS